ncbi:hypothetical protein ENBRE01_1210 [Enteropsectra breve]|nr:hypothetical protein ENBRE01_1210 [Enteropsectra breve]
MQLLWLMLCKSKQDSPALFVLESDMRKEDLINAGVNVAYPFYKNERMAYDAYIKRKAIVRSVFENISRFNDEIFFKCPQAKCRRVTDVSWLIKNHIAKGHSFWDGQKNEFKYELICIYCGSLSFIEPIYCAAQWYSLYTDGIYSLETFQKLMALCRSSPIYLSDYITTSEKLDSLDCNIINETHRSREVIEAAVLLINAINCQNAHIDGLMQSLLSFLDALDYPVTCYGKIFNINLFMLKICYHDTDGEILRKYLFNILDIAIGKSLDSTDHFYQNMIINYFLFTRLAPSLKLEELKKFILSRYSKFLTPGLLKILMKSLNISFEQIFLIFLQKLDNASTLLSISRDYSLELTAKALFVTDTTDFSKIELAFLYLLKRIATSKPVKYFGTLNIRFSMVEDYRSLVNVIFHIMNGFPDGECMSILRYVVYNELLDIIFSNNNNLRILSLKESLSIASFYKRRSSEERPYYIFIERCIECYALKIINDQQIDGVEIDRQAEEMKTFLYHSATIIRNIIDNGDSVSFINFGENSMMSHYNAITNLIHYDFICCNKEHDSFSSFFEENRHMAIVYNGAYYDFVSPEDLNAIIMKYDVTNAGACVLHEKIEPELTNCTYEKISEWCKTFHFLGALKQIELSLRQIPTKLPFITRNFAYVLKFVDSVYEDPEDAHLKAYAMKRLFAILELASGDEYDVRSSVYMLLRTTMPYEYFNFWFCSLDIEIRLEILKIIIEYLKNTQACYEYSMSDLKYILAVYDMHLRPLEEKHLESLKEIALCDFHSCICWLEEYEKSTVERVFLSLIFYARKSLKERDIFDELQIHHPEYYDIVINKIEMVPERIISMLREEIGSI